MSIQVFVCACIPTCVHYYADAIRYIDRPITNELYKFFKSFVSFVSRLHVKFIKIFLKLHLKILLLV